MAQPLPNNRVRTFTEMPEDRFFFEPEDIAEYRDDSGIVATVDPTTRQLRLQHWPNTMFVSWEKCRLLKSKDEVQAEANPPATEETEPETPNAKKQKASR